METSSNLLKINVENIPAELNALPQWVCWRLEPDKRSGRDCKVPYSPKGGHRVSPSNPATWGTMAEALFCAEKYLYGGIGFAFTEENGYVAKDIDNCIDDNGQLNETATDIINHTPSTYIEYSPSGRGIHIITKGKIPSVGNRNSKTGVEMYSSDRYFTITGKHMPDEVGLHIDHIIPISKGGKSIPSNLRVLCSKCNGSKSGK